MTDSHPSSSSSDSILISKLTAQVKKLTEANGKYKNLLKLAKERIQQQEDEIDELRNANAKLEKQSSGEADSSNNQNNPASLDELLGGENQNHNGQITANKASADDSNSLVIVRVCQRVKVVNSKASANSSTNTGGEAVWALMELEHVNAAQEETSHPSKRFWEWKKFDSESQLKDYIRRDTGEPLALPPYSFTPEQSSKIQKEALQEVAAVTEEFRRFRVKAELARKQADSHIRDLQNSQKQSAVARLAEDGEGSSSNGVSSSTASNASSAQHQNGGSSALLAQNEQHFKQMEQLRKELASQEAYWKDAYETLLSENNALKSAGSEALLASQWRQRYEQSQQEKENLQMQLEDIKKVEEDENLKYEAKYRDLKESFRMYRKKAKEIFETSPAANAFNAPSGDPMVLALADGGSADAKLNYLRNLMVNYLTSETEVKNHMEAAIGTILQFSERDVERIEKKRTENEAW
eukprot:CAMPEP_0172442516 /NCGR_PEP_ID=MMETSP1065-20121228/2927_1 /TAXON_ID=265537 /ORGANISM="Amphiprora paludosa, Strain CCMP125" /LENGTH=467 /DNA_ID=CAMNT_0013192395 /DNA_START=126 /DNA_END=1526 /DNA_ORIENTATION=+